MTKSVPRGKKTAKKSTTRTPAKKSARASLTKKKQAALFDKAVALFNAGQFRKALDVFENAAGGESPEIAHSARVYKNVCKRRLAAGGPKLESAEEHYNYAIALINRREPGEALDHLREALRQSPKADHVHYAMAICYGLQGEVEEAAKHLSTAIQLEPRNRLAARRDADFQSFASAPEITRILEPERAPAG